MTTPKTCNKCGGMLAMDYQYDPELYCRTCGKRWYFQKPETLDPRRDSHIFNDNRRKLPGGSHHGIRG